MPPSARWLGAAGLLPFLATAALAWVGPAEWRGLALFALEGEAGEEFDSDFGRARISHTCANDGTVEGIELIDGRAFSVQYHPEAAAGPHDAAYLFEKFVSLLQGARA